MATSQGCLNDSQFNNVRDDQPGNTMSNSRSTIRFILGDEVRHLSDVFPTMTVLDYLRTEERLTGTKEGCGEGDCGACTVVMGEAIDGKMLYRAVNACIQFLPTLDGRQLLTVEHLANDDGALHPVQEAMVECHGSQCGFCTPGFVMSLFAMNRSGATSDRDTINDSIAGNLCRCTGYGPIVEAAQCMNDSKAPDRIRDNETATIKRLQELDDGLSLSFQTGVQWYFAPRSGDELATVYQDHPDAVIFSGGTDVGLWVTKQGRSLSTLIHIGRVTDLQGIGQADGEISVRAATTMAELLPVLVEHYPDFAELVRRFGSVQVRNVGTLCGNVANGSPVGDSTPALIALGARIGLRNGNLRREMPLEDYFIDYGVQDRNQGEFVERIVFPQAVSDRRFAIYKLSKRFDQDISAVCGAFNLKLDGDDVADIRVAYGGMATTPKRATRAEQAMIGQPWCEDTVAAAMLALEEDFTPISDVRASAEYRILAAKNLIRRFYLETGKKETALRLVGGEGRIHAT